MIEHISNTGTDGQLKIEDRTDDPSVMLVDLFVKSAVPLSAFTLAWSYSIEAVDYSVRAFNFASGDTDWQQLGSIYVGLAQDFTLRMGNSSTTELAGPTDFNVALYGYNAGGSTQTVDVRVGGVYKKAQTHVRVAGVWKTATPFVKKDGVWVQIL